KHRLRDAFVVLTGPREPIMVTKFVPPLAVQVIRDRQVVFHDAVERHDRSETVRENVPAVVIALRDVGDRADHAAADRNARRLLVSVEKSAAGPLGLRIESNRAQVIHEGAYEVRPGIAEYSFDDEHHGAD